MLIPPPDLPNEILVRALAEGWGLNVVALRYRAVGFGSHHWNAVDAAGVTWFVTVDDLGAKRHSLNEDDDASFARLQAALTTAVDLDDSGQRFVIAPVSTVAGASLMRTGRFAVALYPYVDGETYAWGEFATPAHRQGVVDLIIALHSVPRTAAPHAIADDFTIEHRDELEAGLDPDIAAPDSGPYAQRVATLLAGNASRIRRTLGDYDDRAAVVRESDWPHRAVLTHGEPHPGNTILTAGGWVLIDWDTTLVSLPERDLWSLDPGDGSALRAYTDATGNAPNPSALALYRTRWDLSDIAVSISWFRREHTGTADDDKSWEELCALVAGLPA
jgi:Phosphotransferase enzyme family